MRGAGASRRRSALFATIEISIYFVLEPLLYGHTTVVAVAFWTWLWGPAGLVLAVPLTVCLVVLGEYVPGLEFIAVLVSDEPVMTANIRYYQRLLAMDQDEAAEIVEAHLEDHTLGETYDAILLPALSCAKRDRARGRLTGEDERFLVKATREIVEDLEPPGIAPRAGTVLGLPVADEADELALLDGREPRHPPVRGWPAGPRRRR